MATFEIEIGGKVYEVDAPDQGTALNAVRSMTGARSGENASSRDLAMGSDGQSGDAIRAANAGNTRSKMPLPGIQSAYRVAQERGDRPEQRAMAEAYVEAERRGSPVMMATSDRVRTIARGIPYLGEALAGATAYTLSPFDEKGREEIRDYQQARDRTFDNQNPYESLALKAAGGIGGTIAAAPMAAGSTLGGLALGLGAKSIPGAIGRGMLAGGMQGAAAGYGGADDTKDAALEAGQKALIGAGLGGAIPGAIAGGRALYNRAVDRFAPADALSSVPARAREWLLGQVGDPNVAAKMQQQARDLGPEGMLADVSPEFRGVAQGASARPGTRATVVDALGARNAAKNARIGSAVDDSLGPVVEPATIRSGLAEGREAVGQQYGEVFQQNARAVNTAPIAQQLDALAIDLRGPAQKAVGDVRKMLNVPGTTELDPNPSALFQTRQAIDGMMANEANPKVIAQLASARQMIDDQLAQSVPGIKGVDARFQEIARQDGALDDATRFLRNGPEGVRPADLRARVSQAPLPKGEFIGPSAEPVRLAQGARAEIDRIVGTNANDVSALRNLLKGDGDWNREKLTILFGKDKAERLLKVLDAETAMENTYRSVVGGSQTGVKQGFNQFLDKTAEGVNVPVEATLPGLSLRGLKYGFERLTGSNNAAKAEKFAGDLARLSVAKGDERDALIKAIMTRVERKGNPAALNDKAGGIGALLAAISARASGQSSPEARPRR